MPNSTDFNRKIDGAAGHDGYVERAVRVRRDSQRNARYSLNCCRRSKASCTTSSPVAYACPLTNQRGWQHDRNSNSKLDTIRRLAADRRRIAHIQCSLALRGETRRSRPALQRHGRAESHSRRPSRLSRSPSPPGRRARVPMAGRELLGARRGARESQPTGYRRGDVLSPSRRTNPGPPPANRYEPFDSRHAKSTYHVDAYFVELDARSPEVLVNRSVYWYSIWSHRRDGLWKGFLQVDLAPAADALAREGLVESSDPEGQP